MAGGNSTKAGRQRLRLLGGEQRSHPQLLASEASWAGLRHEVSPQIQGLIDLLARRQEARLLNLSPLCRV